MNWFEKLFQSSKEAETQNTPQKMTELFKVERCLTSVSPDKAPYVACLALLAARLAGADNEISAGERKRIVEVLQKEAQLSDTEALAVTEIVAAQELNQGIEHSRITSLMRDLIDDSEKQEVIRNLFYIACDEDISEIESEKIRAIATALGLPQSAYIQIRQEFSEYRSILKNSPFKKS